jgi:hypothetical protein
MHPELHLETSTLVLVVWTTLVAGVIAAGWQGVILWQTEPGENSASRYSRQDTV